MITARDPRHGHRRCECRWFGCRRNCRHTNPALAQLQRERLARRRYEREARERERCWQARRSECRPWRGVRGREAPEGGYPRRHIELLNTSDEPGIGRWLSRSYPGSSPPHRHPGRGDNSADAGWRGAATSRPEPDASIIAPGRHQTDVSGDWGVLTGRAPTEIAFTDPLTSLAAGRGRLPQRDRQAGESSITASVTARMTGERQLPRNTPAPRLARVGTELAVIPTTRR
jgi:hypothetical protein